jgi:hypothetical protein
VTTSETWLSSKEARPSTLTLPAKERRCSSSEAVATGSGVSCSDRWVFRPVRRKRIALSVVSLTAPAANTTQLMRRRTQASWSALGRGRAIAATPHYRGPCTASTVSWPALALRQFLSVTLIALMAATVTLPPDGMHRRIAEEMIVFASAGLGYCGITRHS